MAKKENRHMPDTPWHVGFALKDEDDPRRHKNKCMYYRKETEKCSCATSNCFMLKCPGSSHCKHYVINESENAKYKYEIDDSYMEQLRNAIENHKDKRVLYSDTQKRKTKKSKATKKSHSTELVGEKEKTKRQNIVSDYQLSCKFYADKICTIMNSPCNMKKSCLFRDNAK